MYTFISVAKCSKTVRPKGNHGMTLTIRYQLVSYLILILNLTHTDLGPW